LRVVTVDEAEPAVSCWAHITPRQCAVGDAGDVEVEWPAICHCPSLSHPCCRATRTNRSSHGRLPVLADRGTSLHFGALIRTQLDLWIGRQIVSRRTGARAFRPDFGVFMFTSKVPVMSEAGFDPEAFGLRTGSLPCELWLFARPTILVAHTGGYLFF
jgi:hypothetical protein